ncbi:MAG: type I glutamate--ammonia ligase [Gammaproteobacteria bacterium]|nr:type I glutamate--ammonia ligase [Gammaproteobacteria bacterium]MCD8542924.1 type I glutamate--ammonia ligase [Gammaproteobacteria bacterium]
MTKNVAAIFDLIVSENVKFVDLRFSDLRAKEHHVTIPVARVNELLFTDGKVFDGSSIDGWASIDKSDMLLKPILESAILDPFFDEKTLIIRCNVYDPETLQPYVRDPRGVALRAEEYIKNTGIADVAYIGHEVEFFVFDDVRWSLDMHKAGYAIDSDEGAWNSNKEMHDGNMGYRPTVKGGYFPVPPLDSSHDLRSEMCLMLEKMGLIPEVHHHEVATANQNEITTRYSSLTQKCDESQTFKYCVRNVALLYGKTVTFMPKPLVGDNGSAMHTHQSLAKDGVNLFSGDVYAGLSELAVYYIGGILKHAKALNAFTNPSTNSYKRLVPGYEAPVKLAYSASNRSAAIRIPFVNRPVEKRIEVRFPDPLANPYLAFSAMVMAGLDGIKNKIHPGEALDKNLYALSEEEAKKVMDMSGSLLEAVRALENDHGFLLEGGVFTTELIGAYIQLKKAEIARLDMTVHPVEFDMYYSQ